MESHKYFFPPLLVVSFFTTLGQSQNDSLDLVKSKQKIFDLYDQVMQGTLPLYNGSDYIEYVPLNEEHPYYLTDEWMYSQVKYDGEWFNNIPILFDIQRGKLIAFNYHTGTTMQLVDELVEEFKMNGHHFVNIKELNENSIYDHSYYELLYDGKTKVLMQRSKIFSRKLEVSQEFRAFLEVSQALIVYDGQYSLIDNKNDILTLLRTKKKEVREFIRVNQLFKAGNKELSLVKVAEYFDGINR